MRRLSSRCRMSIETVSANFLKAPKFCAPSIYQSFALSGWPRDTLRRSLCAILSATDSSVKMSSGALVIYSTEEGIERRLEVGNSAIQPRVRMLVIADVRIRSKRCHGRAHGGKLRPDIG